MAALVFCLKWRQCDVADEDELVMFTVMISHISLGSIVPSPLTSYIWNAHSSFCSGLPADVMLMASRNSLKSIFPLLSESNVLNTWAQNLSALP